MVDESTTTSALDSTQTLRIVRSHRAPRKSRRWVSVAVAVVVAAGSVQALPSSEPQAEPSQVTATQILQVEPRSTMSASRSFVRQAPSRAQKIEKVIAYAYAQRGDRYVWGASGPSKWDCSGLVSVAFKKGAGVKLPHFTGGIQKRGYKVARKNLKRGDIIFPQRGHVGIYLGGGKMIHASSGKGKVVVSKVYGFYTARRVI